MFMIKLTEYVNFVKQKYLNGAEFAQNLLSFSINFGKNGWMTFLVKRTLFHLLLLNLDVMQTPEITHMKSLGITEVRELTYF